MQHAEYSTLSAALSGGLLEGWTAAGGPMEGSHRRSSIISATCTMLDPSTTAVGLLMAPDTLPAMLFLTAACEQGACAHADAVSSRHREATAPAKSRNQA